MNAVYQNCGLPNYDGNPLIAALPKILEPHEAATALTKSVGYDESMRNLNAGLRSHSVHSILEFFQPLNAHLDLEGKVSRMIRFGYTGKNPTENKYYQDGVARLGVFQNPNANPSLTASTTILGTSGTGKTTAVNRILSLYPQIITHTEFNGAAFPHSQLVWLKLECPFDGSVKAIARNFFASADRVLNTDYQTLYGVRNMSTDEMLPKIALIGWNHSLGLLVIDEIQHLSMAKSGGAARALNFFVELTNTMHIPILLIGTTKAIRLLSQEFRSARRGCGQGEMVWRPMAKDSQWDIFLTSLWRYQFTKHKTPLNEDISSALHEESQGITDFAVKLYMLSQIREIGRGEEVTVKTVRSVARDSLQSAQPFLQALRSGDFKHLANYDDIIQPLDYNRLAQEQAAKAPIQIIETKAEPEEAPAKPKPKRTKCVAVGGILEVFANRGKSDGYSALKEAGLVKSRVPA
jgi:hypothetical protein